VPIAEFVTVPRNWLVPKPANLSMAQTAASGVPFIVAYEALVRVGQLRKGKTLLITGADGAVGRAATQIAHRLVLDAVGGDLFEPALRTLRLGGRQIAIAVLEKAASNSI
jgi:NADPH2:quinone reductase